MLLPLGDSVQLVSNVNVDPLTLQYIWTPQKKLTCESGTCEAPTVSPLEATRYTVLVTDVNGCTAQASTLVEVQKSRNIFIPNIFTPNNDTHNDKWMVFGGTGVVKIKSLNIFDRWGEQVFGLTNFQPNDPAYGWDGFLNGEPMRPGVFIYTLEVEFIDGLTIPYKGDFTLVR